MTTPNHDAIDAALTSVLTYTAAQMAREALSRHGLAIIPAGEAAMRSADEIRAELARCNSEAVRSANYNANKRKELTLANDARIAALEWVLSPSKPQEPGK